MTAPSAALTSGYSVEWYTPPDVIQRVRDVLGGIDLDPASCATANATVQARLFYTSSDDGLRQSWQGRVFCNPPYGHGAQGRWASKLIAEYRAGNVSQAILLVNAAVGARWFRPLWGYPLCFPDRRICFLSPDGVPKRDPTHHNALVYFGNHVERFDEVFSVIGHVAPPRSYLAPGGRL